jgi:hypothetical protein
VLIRYYGVKCINPDCRYVIKLARTEEPDRKKLVVDAPPLEEIKCDKCQTMHVYGSDDIIEFETR